MSVQHRITLVSLAALIALGTGPACGQKFPTKPIRMLTSGVGGGADFSARLIAQGLAGNVGQPVIVENRGSQIPGEVVSKATPDGYTLTLSTNSLWTGPLLRPTPYDPVKDFAPVTLALSFPTIMATTTTIPANSVKEFIALARAKPGELNYLRTSTGGSGHLAAELFQTLAGVKLTPIFYKSAGTGIVDMIAGRVHVFFSAAGPVMPLVKDGKLRALGVTTAKPSTLFPGLPTVAAAVPGYEMIAVYCVFAPAKTPAAIINTLHREIVRALNAPDAREKFFNSGLEVVGSTPEQLAAMLKTDIVRLKKLIKDAGIEFEK